MDDWTPAMVDARLEGAADVFSILPEVKPQGYFNAWPGYFHSFADKVGQLPQMPRPRPSPRQITQAEETLLWLRWLDPDDARLLWLRPTGRRGSHMQFFSVEALNAAIAELLADLNARPMRRISRSRHDLLEEIGRPALRALPPEPFEYAAWKQAKVHPDYHIDVLHNFYSVPHRLIGKQVDVRLTHRMVEIFHTYERVAVHTRRGTRGGHSTVNPAYSRKSV